jgi:hypothetical protein
MRILHVTGYDRVLRTYVDTGRCPADFNTVSTVVALRSRIVVRINVERVIRTGLHARFASDATVIVKIDDAVITCVQGLNRADFNTWGIRAMITSHHGEDPSGIRKFSFFYLLNIGSVYADRNVVFTFTGRCACMTTDALSVVNNKSVSHGKEASFN